MNTYIKAKIRLLTEEESKGRRIPVMSGYKPTLFMLDEDEVPFYCKITFEDSQLAIGKTYLVNIALDKDPAECLIECKSFILREGFRVVGVGEIVEYTTEFERV